MKTKPYCKKGNILVNTIGDICVQILRIDYKTSEIDVFCLYDRSGAGADWTGKIKELNIDAFVWHLFEGKRR
jgi:hypothetical protein